MHAAAVLLMLCAPAVLPPEIEPLPDLAELNRFPSLEYVEREIQAAEIRSTHLRKIMDEIEAADLKDTPEWRAYDALRSELQDRLRPWYHVRYLHRHRNQPTRPLMCVYRTLEGGYITVTLEGKTQYRFDLAEIRDLLGREQFNAGQLPSLHFDAPDRKGTRP